jgi:hypothetical protein
MPANAEEILEQHFLEMRAKLIDLAATFDRIDRGEDAVSVSKDDRLVRLHQAAAILNESEPDRAARIQMLFSDAYDPDWERPAAGS